jgi:hypothetical protein
MSARGIRTCDVSLVLTARPKSARFASEVPRTCGCIPDERNLQFQTRARGIPHMRMHPWGLVVYLFCQRYPAHADASLAPEVSRTCGCIPGPDSLQRYPAHADASLAHLSLRPIHQRATRWVEQWHGEHTCRVWLFSRPVSSLLVCPLSAVALSAYPSLRSPVGAVR